MRAYTHSRFILAAAMPLAISAGAVRAEFHMGSGPLFTDDGHTVQEYFSSETAYASWEGPPAGFEPGGAESVIAGPTWVISLPDGGAIGFSDPTGQAAPPPLIAPPGDAAGPGIMIIDIGPAAPELPLPPHSAAAVPAPAGAALLLLLAAGWCGQRRRRRC